MSEPLSTDDKVSGVLDDLHQMLCDDQRERSAVQLAIAAFYWAGLITEEQYRLRTLALTSCPGHKGSRSWCAYCGELPEVEERSYG